MIKLARTIRINKDEITAAVRPGLKNARLERLNSKVCLTGRHSYGFHGPRTFRQPIYLCVGASTSTYPFTASLSNIGRRRAP
ncbi:MAG TPA: transposase, partial [Candidatus Dormibacteraeota bacterium]|nr:transposase [Candidatus Dormibacteraeota bacterium]